MGEPPSRLKGAEAMGNIGTTHLFDVEFEIGDMHMVGNTPYGQRAIANVAGGTFSGARLRGRVLPGGGDWGLFRSDGTLSVDARSCLETDDQALICVTYGGRWRISPELLMRLSDPEQIGSVDPSDYYLRTLVLFETAAGKYAWLNDIAAVGVGRRTVKGIAYSVHEVL
jgi:hypothetical protein